MLKPKLVSFGVGVFLLLLVALPLPLGQSLRSSFYSSLEKPLSFTSAAAQIFEELTHFHQNAQENRELKSALARLDLKRTEAEEMRIENARLTRLLDLKPFFEQSGRSVRTARVISKSASSWSRSLLVDKGTRAGLKAQQAVLSEFSLVGKIVEAGPSVSKVLLIHDPNSRIGVLIQRTRQDGILYGTLSGLCRVKYISMETPVKPGDIVETAGFGGFFPKGLPVGKIDKVWKEPGQMYQVAELKPLADLSRIEEVEILE